MISWVGFSFFKRIRIPDALWAFGWIPKNWDSFKDTRWLSRVDLFGSGRDTKNKSNVIRKIKVQANAKK